MVPFAHTSVMSAERKAREAGAERSLTKLIDFVNLRNEIQVRMKIATYVNSH